MKRICAVLTAGLLCLGLTACGADGQAEVQTGAVEETGASETAEGTYAYEEKESFGEDSFSIPWTLTLNGDGTYSLHTEGPMGEDTYTGTYTMAGSNVTTSAPKEADVNIMAGWFNEDYSCEWIINEEDHTCAPAKAGTQEGESGVPEGVPGGMPGMSTEPFVYDGEYYTDVQYAQISASDVMDIYLPDTDEATPVVVMIHGGAFRMGDKQMDAVTKCFGVLLDHNYAVATINYRLSDEATYPAAVADAKAAVRYLKANADQYGIDAENIYIRGESAGAYLANMVAVTSDVEELNGDVEDNLEQSSSVKALISFFAPIDWYNMDKDFAELGVTEAQRPMGITSQENSAESAFLGQNVAEDEAKTAATNPINYVEGMSQSQFYAFIEHGDADTNVPYVQSERLYDALSTKYGTEYVTLTILPQAAHEDAAFYTDENLAQIIEFLDAVPRYAKQDREKEEIPVFDEIQITNKTMELLDCKDAWTFDETNCCWCLEDILYTQKATTPKFQRLSIFVPKPYMRAGGEIDPEGEMNGYTARTVPVIFENNSAGYMQMPHTWLEGPRCYAHQYLKQGYVYVTCGNRGHESRDAEGKLCGKAPVNLVDLKTGIRFIRHNRAWIPGDMDKIISVGWSAGGAMSALLAVTGNNENFIPYLEENGAFMEESDAVYASQIYCPIVDLEHADLAYEWLFFADRENEASPAGPAGTMTAFEEALSGKLKEAYVEYFNSLKLVNPDNGEILLLSSDGRSGSGYDYLMKKLNEAAGIYFAKLEKGELPQQYSPEDYLRGNYTYKIPAPMGGPKEEDKADLMQGHAGPGVALQKTPMTGAEKQPTPPSLGDMVSRPPKGVPYQPPTPPMMEVKGKDKSEWLSWDGERAVVKDLDSYVLNHRRRMKPCTSFDILRNESGENKVFGTREHPNMHFNTYIAKAILELKEQFPEEYEKYYGEYAAVRGDAELARRIYMINPLNYIGTDEKSDMAKYCRIRVGASDADTAFSVSMTLALKLAEAGIPTDYRFVWEQPHCEADYVGEVIDWIESIV